MSGDRSSKARPRALLVEDDPGHLEAMQELVAQEGFDVRTSTTVANACETLDGADFDLLVTDLELPDGTSLDLLPVAREHPEMEFVLVTAHGSVDSAVEAFRAGAVDYLTKPIDVARLRKILGHVKRAARLRSQVLSLRNELRDLGRFGPMIGASPPMQAVYDQIQKVAPTHATVLVTGETGTGKELVASTVHELSPRADGPFVALNCGAVSSELFESELFGHEKGSFTGAVARHAGCFERADGGTLFLDEVTEMPLELQVKLLRTLETGEVQRVGSERLLRVDVRVVAASNRDPHQAVIEGRLREDLLYRLHVFPIELPPLRRRPGDLDLIADHFLAHHNRREDTRKALTRAARERLRMHDWPGNVRELRNVIERAYIMAEDEIGPDCVLLGAVSAPSASSASDSPDAGENLGIRVGMSNAEVERILTLATLDHYGEKKRTAEVLGISQKTLYNRLKSYES